MRSALAMLLMLVPISAMAQQPKPDLVMIPREIAMAALQWISEPNATVAVRLYSALSACINDNPVDGRVQRMGQDQCPTVTESLAARDAELATLRKQVEDAKAKSAELAKPQ